MPRQSAARSPTDFALLGRPSWINELAVRSTTDFICVDHRFVLDKNSRKLVIKVENALIESKTLLLGVARSLSALRCHAVGYAGR